MNWNSASEFFAMGGYGLMGGALSRTLVHLEPYIQPLVVKSQLDRPRKAGGR